MGKKKGKSAKGKGQTLSLADFNPEAFAQDNLVPTHSSGAEAPKEFGQTKDEDKEWTRGGPDGGPTRPAREPARGDMDSDWRSSAPEHREIPSGGRETAPADDSNWRGTQRGLGDEDANWRGSANAVSREEEAMPVAETRLSAGANRGQADGDGDWRGSAGPVVRPDDAPAPQRESAGAVKGRAETITDWRGSAGPVVRPDDAPAPQRESAGAVKGRAETITDWRGSAAPVVRSEETVSTEPETTWRGTARGVGSRADWSRDSCGPTSRSDAGPTPRRAPVSNAAPARDISNWRGSAGPTSRAEAPPARGRGGPPACMFFARGQCQRGESCRFSHDEETINAFKAEQEENRKNQLELRLAQGPHGSAPSSPVCTPTKNDNDISAKKEATPAAANQKTTDNHDNDGFEVVTKPRKAHSSQQRQARGVRMPPAGRAW